MPYIRRKEFDRLQRAGGAMSNICFNLKQHSKVSAEANIMHDAQTEWDAAVGSVRKRWIAIEDRQKV